MIFRLVTRLFVRRLVDNDLISPHADRRQTFAVMYALIISLAVFATFFLSTNYLAAFVMLPGVAALGALSDRFLFITASIAISALGALIVWDALALEPRDAAILGPLPIPARTITRAKLAAALLFGAVMTVALNAVPSVLYPALLTLNIRGTRGTTILRLMGAHATMVVMAGLFGFFAVLAIRGVLRLLLGEAGFRRISSGAQSALVVAMVTALLLAPTVRATDVRRWVDGTTARPLPVDPVLWYLGLNETLAGHLVADIPVVLPPRFSFVVFPTEADVTSRSIYRALRSPFIALARRAWLSWPTVTALALLTFLWTNRRLPDRTAAAPGRSRIRSLVLRLAERLTGRDTEAQAGFFFTLQTLTRSAPHRTLVAIAVAVGLTHALIVLAGIGDRPSGIASMPLGVFGISILALMSLMAGVAHAVTVPAALGANWTIRMAWPGDERRYLAGCKRAAMLLAATLSTVLLPLHIAVFGVPIAVVHSLLGLLAAAAALDARLLPYRGVPFACGYVPIENPKVVWPAGLAGLLVTTYTFARIERWALPSGIRTAALAVALGAAAFALDAIDRSRRRERRPVDFDGRPTRAAQRLGLFEHVVEDA